MMNKEHAENFLFKVDMDGLDYAVQNYSPKNTGDVDFEKILQKLQLAIYDMEAYIEELRDKYDIKIF